LEFIESIHNEGVELERKPTNLPAIRLKLTNGTAASTAPFREMR